MSGDLKVLGLARGKVVFLSLCALLAACSPPEPIRIGFVAGISGRVADLGIAGRNAVILAVDEKNAAGGIAGRPVELLVRDDQQDVETARRVVQELIDARVEAVVGHMTSSMSAATLPLVNQARLPMISPTSTSRIFSGLDDYFFRVIATTRMYAGDSARFHRERLKLARVVAIYDRRNRSYCESWLEDYRTAFEKAGGTMVEALAFDSGIELQAGELAQQLLAKRPDAIVIVANSVDAAQISQKIRARDARVLLLASEWPSTEQLIELGGRAVEGMYVAQHFDRDSQSPAYLRFRAAYMARFGQEPGFAGVAAYDAATILLAALESKKPGQTLKEALLAIRDFPGLQETLGFDAYGETSRNHHIATIRDGRFVKIEP